MDFVAAAEQAGSCTPFSKLAISLGKKRMEILSGNCYIFGGFIVDVLVAIVLLKQTSSSPSFPSGGRHPSFP